MLADSQKIFGCCNVFSLAKGLTITEIVWVVVTLILGFTVGSVDVSAFGILIPMIPIAYLVIECIGIHKKNKCLIIFGCVIRVLQQIFIVIFIALVFMLNVFFYDVCKELSNYVEYENCETFM